MTVTLLTSQSAPTTTDADALVTGVFQGQDGPVLTLSTNEIDLMAALTALGATGKAEELTKIPTGGQLPAPVIVAVGLGPEPVLGVLPQRSDPRPHLEAGRAAPLADRHLVLDPERLLAHLAHRGLDPDQVARRDGVAVPELHPVLEDCELSATAYPALYVGAAIVAHGAGLGRAFGHDLGRVPLALAWPVPLLQDGAGTPGLGPRPHGASAFQSPAW